jgi:hypothetical protein
VRQSTIEAAACACTGIGTHAPHHIDNLEAAIPSDTVDIEVNDDSYSCFSRLLAG